MKPRVSQLAQSGATAGLVVAWNNTSGQWEPLDVQGPVSTKTASYTMTAADRVILANGTSLTVTLPSAVTAGATGRVFTVKNLNASALTVNATAGTIDGAASSSLAQNARISVVSDGTNWQVVG